MPWTNGRPFPPGETRSLYAHWWLEHLDRETRERSPLDDSALPRVRPVHLVEDDGWISAAYAPDPRAVAAAVGPRAAEESTEAPGLLDVLVHSERENGPVPIALPGDVFNRDPTVGAHWESVTAPADGSVIVAIIDDAIGFANARFRRRSGPRLVTRLDYIWLQGVATSTTSGLPFGRELTGPDIDALLQQFTRGGLVDEQALYREIGFVDFRSSSVQSAASAVSHGTAVADRAGGHRDPDSEFAEMVTLMGACLPSQVIGDTSGTFIELFMIAAIERIRRRVRWLEQASGRRYPLIINMSFALTAGNVSPAANTVVWHRRGLLDTYLRYAVADHYAGPGPHAPLFFIGPAGNHRLARTHAVVRPGPHPPLRWRVLPDDRTPSFIELWSDPEPWPSAPTIHCSLRPPGVAGPLPPPPSVAFDQFSELVINGKVYAAAHYSWYPENPAVPQGPGRERVLVAVRPTAPEWLGEPTGPSGDWDLTVLGAAVRVDLRVQRDDSLAGYRQRGRQSFFIDDTYRVYDTAGRTIEIDNGSGLVTRLETVNQLMTPDPVHIVLVPAYARLGPWSDTGNGGAPGRGVSQTIYSGLGTSVPLAGVARQFADGTPVHRGVVTTGTPSGSSASLSGTSLAAPWAARALASRLIHWPTVGLPAAIPQLPEHFGQRFSL